MPTDERSTFFDVFGPLPIEHDDRVISAAQSALWNKINDEWPGLSNAIGCYMFCINTVKNIHPWYVGMTIAQTGFRGEAFQEHKLRIYNEIIKKRRGVPVIFLFPLMTPSDRYSKGGASQKPVIRWLERFLMMQAYARNSKISNVRDMKFLRQVEVLGVLGERSGRPYREVEQVRRALYGTTRRLDGR